MVVVIPGSRTEGSGGAGPFTPCILLYFDSEIGKYKKIPIKQEKITHFHK
jgi:hypothetical protein